MLVAFVLVLSGCSQNSSVAGVSKIKAVVYKSPNCGCCVKHVSYLKENGFDVDIVLVDDMESIKQKYEIPPEMESCHTTIVGNYFIEGHVPIEAIDKLLLEQSDIDGIALPGMPSGSPGMPGIKRGSFDIQAVSEGTTSDFISI